MKTIPGWIEVCTFDKQKKKYKDNDKVILHFPYHSSLIRFSKFKILILKLNWTYSKHSYSIFFKADFSPILLWFYQSFIHFSGLSNLFKVNVCMQDQIKIA